MKFIEHKRSVSKINILEKNNWDCINEKRKENHSKAVITLGKYKKL